MSGVGTSANAALFISAQATAPLAIFAISTVAAAACIKSQVRRRKAVVSRWERLAGSDIWGPHSLMDATAHAKIIRAIATSREAAQHAHSPRQVADGIGSTSIGLMTTAAPPEPRTVSNTPANAKKCPRDSPSRAAARKKAGLLGSAYELDHVLRFLRNRPSPAHRSLGLHLLWRAHLELVDSRGIDLMHLFLNEYLALAVGQSIPSETASPRVPTTSTARPNGFLLRVALWACEHRIACSPLISESPPPATDLMSKAKHGHVQALLALNFFRAVTHQERNIQPGGHCIPGPT
ncbi:hypothetical protein BC828DRAFT_234710 [Blastocladiella britannica]|nr:hypothetical protein BC828DRAFT_234710 [Blastocladiella britannica]